LGFLDATKVNRLVKVIVSAVLIYAAYCLLLFLAQRQVIFPRYMIPSPAPMDLSAAGIEQAWLDTSFGRVETWYIPPAAGVAGAPTPAVIF
jgi:hypothetical protein